MSCRSLDALQFNRGREKRGGGVTGKKKVQYFLEGALVTLWVVRHLLYIFEELSVCGNRQRTDTV